MVEFYKKYLSEQHLEVDYVFQLIYPKATIEITKISTVDIQGVPKKYTV